MWNPSIGNILDAERLGITYHVVEFGAQIVKTRVQAHRSQAKLVQFGAKLFGRQAIEVPRLDLTKTHCAHALQSGGHTVEFELVAQAVKLQPDRAFERSADADTTAWRIDLICRN